MFANPKNLSHHQALESLQSLFPSITLATFSSSNSLRAILDSLSSSLPMPQHNNHQNVIQSMKNIVDTQQYKIQRNMIEIQNYTEYIENDNCQLDFYEQRSTAIEYNKKTSYQTSDNSVMSDQSEDLWWNMQQKNNSQQQLQKQCFSFLD